MSEYRLTLGVEVVRLDDGAILSPDETNPDWQRYRAWLADGGAPDPVDLSALKAAKRMEVEAAFASAVAAGMAYGGKKLQIDDASRGRLGDVATLAGFVALGVPGLAWPADMVDPGWRMTDDTYIAFSTPAAFLGMAQGAAVHYMALRRRLGALKDAVAKAADAAALDKIDPTAGW